MWRVTNWSAEVRRARWGRHARSLVASRAEHGLLSCDRELGGGQTILVTRLGVEPRTYGLRVWDKSCSRVTLGVAPSINRS